MRLAEHFISFFCNEFYIFNNTGARMLDSFYHMTFRILKSYFGVKTLGFCHMRDVKSLIS